MKKILLLLLCFICLNAKNSISEKVYKQLQKANKLIEKKQESKAKTILNSIIKIEDNNLAKSYAYQSLASISLRNNNYKNTIKYYEKIVELNSLKKEEIAKVKFSLSQLYLSEGIYKKSISYSNELLKSSFPKKNHLIENLALAYYHDTQYKKSISYIKQILNHKKNKESWYKMLYSAYINMKDYEEAITTLKYMITIYNKNETYWMQLVSLYQTVKEYKKSLATLELIYENNVVSQKKNILYLVNILIQNKIYNKAALLIEDGLKNGIIEKEEKSFNLLISTLLNAKNYKKVIYLLTNSSFAKNDKFQLMLGNIYYNKGEYTNAIDALKNHKFKANTKYDGKRYSILALSFYELDNKNSSKKYLKLAAQNRYEKTRAFNLAKSLGYEL